jgi:hypothetical protein
MKTYNFTEWSRKNQQAILQQILRTTVAMPSRFNERDYRSKISQFYVESLCQRFDGVLQDCGSSIGYDFEYLRSNLRKKHSTQYPETVSLKSEQSEVFSRPQKNWTKRWTAGKAIQMKNFHGEGNRELTDSDFNYLFVIQRFYDKPAGLYRIGFAVADFDTCKSYLHKYGDQARLRMPSNDQWQFFSGIKNISLNRDQEMDDRLNEIADSCQSEMFSRLLAEVDEEVCNVSDL